MKFNREPKLQELSLVDIAKDVSKLKQEVQELRRDLQTLQEGIDHSYPVDHWARQEILMLQTRLDSIPPPLEDVPQEAYPGESSQPQNQTVQLLKVLSMPFLICRFCLLLIRSIM
jgi:chromosome segregation ATPase